MILTHIDEAMAAGARQSKACEIVGLSVRTIERWRRQGGGEDCRRGPNSAPANKLSEEEHANVVEVLTSPEFRDLSPRQIVPILADQDIFLASESTMYRILRAERLLAHRGKSRPPTRRQRPDEHVATKPNEVWSWDISYLKSPVRGIFWYLYFAVDVWSRKIVAWAVHAEESSEHAAALLAAAYRREDVVPGSLVVHMDNGSPMKGATLVATLQSLGVMASYSRPSVSNDNAYSESLFRTLKYRPVYPSGPFDAIEAARARVADFVRWYNTEHLHSAIRFVTPEDRHSGRDLAILEQRQEVYRKARARRPGRWAAQIRNWNPIEEVRLNSHDRTLQKTG